MNPAFYHALMRTASFFKYYGHIRYRSVPVARAMFYAFHRKEMKRLSKRRLRAYPNMKARKRKLYTQLIRTEPLRRLPYRPHPRLPGKIIYSPHAVQGISVHPRTSIVCGQLRSDRKMLGRSQVPFCIPAQMRPLNKKSYRILLRHIRRTMRNKRVPSYLRTRSFYRWMAAQLVDVMRIIDGTERLMRKNRIKGVVQHSTVHPLGYILMHMAKQRGIRTINLQHGLNDDYQLMSSYVHYYVAWGSMHKKRLTLLGVPARKIALIGSPRFDVIYRRKWLHKAQLARKLKYSAKKFVFVYPEQPLNIRKNRAALRLIVRSLTPYRRKVILIVKKHPRQRKSTLSRHTLRKLRYIRQITHRHLHLYHLLKGSNAVIVQFSTAGIEAMLFRRPTIALAMYKNTLKHEFSYYASSRWITSARGQRQMNAITRKMISSKRYRNAVLRKQNRYLRSAYRVKVAGPVVKKYIRARTGR
ncbi:UDP-N-acetylglucosamine 2-epimerase [Marinicrinis sediminis]|uniref:UDP-N-acetylglucosamine 2-epimerase n=1 Tax=Marinicrinis sediminis TaxID=1652465 RepID=A0ABW5R7N1_9BACL